MAVALFSVCIANAQMKDEIQKSRDRAAKLQVLCNDYKTCGSAGIDGYGNDMKAAALLAISNSEQLEKMYERQIGETADGVKDVTIKKPTIEDWITLSTTVAAEAISVKAAVDKAAGAGEEAKNLATEASNVKNPMKAAKAVKTAKAATAVIEFGNAATPVLLEETGNQAKAINEIITTLKSGKNL